MKTVVLVALWCVCVSLLLVTQVPLWMVAAGGVGLLVAVGDFLRDRGLM